MKPTAIYGLLLAAMASPMFCSCDDVDQADRLIPVEKVEAEKAVLIFEFTGQLCVNCPRGAETVNALQAAYPGLVIAVNLHPQNTAFTNVPDNYNIGLTSEIATEYYEAFGRPNQFPAAMVDLNGLNISTGTWTKSVENALKQSTPVTLNLASNYDGDTRQLTVDWDTFFNDAYTGEATVLVLLIQNGLVGYQVGAPKPKEYVHNHVLRASLNGLWGDSLGTDFRAGERQEGQLTFTVPQEWVAEDMEVVGAVLDAAHHSMQAAMVHMTPHN